jgi:hypothetical protein
MAEQHLSVHVPNTAHRVDREHDGRSTQLLLGVTGGAGYLCFLAFVVLRIAVT